MWKIYQNINPQGITKITEKTKGFQLPIVFIQAHIPKTFIIELLMHEMMG